MEPTAVTPPTSTLLVNRALVLLGDAPIDSLSDGSTQAAIASTFYQPAFEEFCCSTAWRWTMRTAIPRVHFLDVRPSVAFWPPSGASMVRFYVGDLVKKYVAPDYRYYRCIRGHVYNPSIPALTDPNGSGADVFWDRIDDDSAAVALYLEVEAVPGDPAYSYEYVLPADFLSLNRVEPSATHELAVAPLNYNADPDTQVPTGIELTRVIWSTGELQRIHYSAKVAESEMPAHAQETFVYKLAHLLAMPIQANRARSEYFYEMYMKSLRRSQAIDARQRPNASIVENGLLTRDWSEI